MIQPNVRVESLVRQNRYSGGGGGLCLVIVFLKWVATLRKLEACRTRRQTLRDCSHKQDKTLPHRTQEHLLPYANGAMADSLESMNAMNSKSKLYKCLLSASGLGKLI